MRYSLEIPRQIRTTGIRLMGANNRNHLELYAIGEMMNYMGFLRELVNDCATMGMIDICRKNYVAARDAAMAIGADVTNFPKGLKLNRTPQFGGAKR